MNSSFAAGQTWRKYNQPPNRVKPAQPAKRHPDLVRPLAQPDGRRARRGVDVAHHPHLLGALGDVLLVDTERVRPDEELTVWLTEVLQRAVEAGPDLGMEPRAADRFSGLRVAPGVGKRGEVWCFVEGGVCEINRQLIRPGSGRELQEADLRAPESGA